MTVHELVLRLIALPPDLPVVFETRDASVAVDDVMVAKRIPPLCVDVERVVVLR